MREPQENLLTLSDSMGVPFASTKPLIVLAAAAAAVEVAAASEAVTVAEAAEATAAVVVSLRCQTDCSFG